MAGRLSVVVSQGQSAHPAKRGLEQELVAALIGEPGIDVVVVPHLYDLAPEGSGVLALNGIRGDMVVVSWLYPRAAHWVLAQHGIRGQMGITQLSAEDETEENDDNIAEGSATSEISPDSNRGAEASADPAQPPLSALGASGSNDAAQRPLEPSSRRIYHLDFRASQRCDDFVDEIRRIAAETSVETVDLMSWVGGTPTPQQLHRYLHPRGPDSRPTTGPASTPSTASRASSSQSPSHSSAQTEPAPAGPSNGNGDKTKHNLGSTSEQSEADGPHGASGQRSADDNGHGKPASGNGHDNAETSLLRIDESPKRRWYPVIDYARCTNCMECIDFCLFGVYGVDSMENILVEQPDNCRKGCPACSRICPENAILFPQHKSPAIAGSPVAEAGALKIDLSKLFGGGDPLETAVEERDRELLAAGRQAVGTSVGIPKRQANRDNEQPKDELDDLIDQLDQTDL